ncbi:hypothetical protein [Actinoplanes awajinensis]|uniref:N-acetyltransferase domain-containing protein n=1 Tax=Actinoplanes awajinensis subsp. mycoplanecinus TaxID=135947 RepID=A0A101JIQ0_9ACTN|nr:hypothetical protein [Actinoplanes awajinensis]KUL27544.1 hypothetical protein ADL15_35195 [Actinoplanes awajinensis subsp. mycoplanecinus]
MTYDIGAEQVEAAFMYDYELGMPEAARTRLGVSAARIGGGVALAMAADPTTYWSKALGFGLTEPFTLALFDEILDFYRGSGVKQAVIQLIPAVLPAGFAAAAAARGVERGTTWIKLGGDPAHVAATPTDLRIGPVPVEQAGAFAGTVLDTFGMPAGDLTTMLASTVGRPGWQPYAAWDGDLIVAGGNVYLHDGGAGLNAAATRAEYRRRGAQGALIAARAAAAAAAGSTRVYAETGKPAPHGHNPSLANMLKAGLTPLYERENWLWRR